MALPNSAVATGLLELFPGLPLIEVDWTRSQLPSSAEASPAKADEVVEQPMQPELLTQLQTSLDAANYHAREGLAERVVSSLAAKPFLILAGLSGSGKTLLGILISHWFSLAPDQVQVVAVGADWTSTHHLLGYPDALDNGRYVRTPALDLLLRAGQNSSIPHFLVLDEMNLSHVERYFSDFLSAMESAQPIHLHGSEESRDDVDSQVDFPKNLFVIGTINVDETTYMFSPKVLDRANVIEFTVSAKAMEGYLESSGELDPTAVLGAGASYGPALVDFGEAEASITALEDLTELVRSQIQALFVALDQAGMQFGFRTAREIIRYLVADRQLHGSGWSVLGGLDAQISQRIVPKLSGDAARLKPILISILAFCAKSEATAAPDQTSVQGATNEMAQAGPEVLQSTCAEVSGKFPITAEKIARMLRRLDGQGFSTAIEA
jgi:5-methylcytosine-specific restriction protein B